MTIKSIVSTHHHDALVREIDEIGEEKIIDISRYFTKNQIDILVVTENKKPIYVLTSSDIIDALVEHMEVMDIYSYIDNKPKKVVAVKENESVFEAYRLMRNRHIHHLVVVDEKEGYYKSVINFLDFASFLTEIALKDEMTGLYNKRFFEFLIDRYSNENIEIGIIFLDLNDFKIINDKYGHIFGDEVIKTAASIIRQSIRNIDYAFRFGGDEFVIMIFASYEVLKKVAKRIEDKINSAKVGDITISCSLGYAHYKTDSSDLKEVIKIADENMYKRKKEIKS
ncbi:MAG: GGDEF domain-containing protein [Nautiliaceae bacterium]|jgi:diguanylate cyclase (GGDEF)-like protein